MLMNFLNYSNFTYVWYTQPPFFFFFFFLSFSLHCSYFALLAHPKSTSLPLVEFIIHPYHLWGKFSSWKTSIYFFKHIFTAWGVMGGGQNSPGYHDHLNPVINLTSSAVLIHYYIRKKQIYFVQFSTAETGMVERGEGQHNPDYLALPPAPPPPKNNNNNNKKQKKKKKKSEKICSFFSSSTIIMQADLHLCCSQMAKIGFPIKWLIWWN